MKIIISITILCLIQFAKANDQMRHWTYVSGDKVEAEIVSFNEQTRIVTLNTSHGEKLELDESLFSAIDQAWILEWIEQDEEARALLEKVGGTVTRYTTTGDYPTTYSLYTPAARPDASDGQKPPLLFLFHPGGNGGRVIYRYVETAAELGVTLVSFDHF